jgi:peptidoglycan/LPS O-acetylase OafA/YrhL
MNFRKDINGLRAIAVIAVVLFHFNPSWVPGGFAGVDVFFVISGFLMTSIIFRGLEQENFSLIKFYIARANRIIPALAVLCLFLLAFGWFFTLDAIYETISKHVTSSLGFFSNVTYWKESGYFEAASHEKWLLHTWSLSTEWQFYIILPITLILMRKFFSLNTTKYIFLLGTLLGFVFCVIATYKWPDPAYYLLPSRAWEMMVGGIAYLYPIKIKEARKRIIEWVGLILIIGSYVFITKDNHWPGYLALLPVLGTFLIIQAGQNNSLFTSNIIFQKLGTWSYSIYLWHWPLVVYMYTYIDTSIRNILLLVALSVFLGMLSNIYIERKVSGLKTLVMFILGLGLAIFISFNNGAFDIREKSHDSGNIILNTYKNYKMDPTDLFRKCNASLQMEDKGSHSIDDVCLSEETGGVFLWGDSHIGALSTGLRHELPSNTPFSQLASSGCAPVFKRKMDSSFNSNKACSYSNRIAEDAILKTKPKIVILGIRHKHERYNWNETISKLFEMGVPKVILVGPVPQWQPSLPLIYVKRHSGEEFIHDANFDLQIIKSNNYLIELHKKNDKFIFINLLEKLCFMSPENEFTCRAKVGDTLLAFDYGHLTVEGSRFVAKNYVIPLL